MGQLIQIRQYPPAIELPAKPQRLFDLLVGNIVDLKMVEPFRRFKHAFLRRHAQKLAHSDRQLLLANLIFDVPLPQLKPVFPDPVDHQVLFGVLNRKRPVADGRFNGNREIPVQNC